MKIISFGDSFVWGSEIAGNDHGQFGWPGLAADLLDCQYQTLATPGCGNENIARQIYTYFGSGSADLAVVNWTWSSRWDYYITETDTWVALGPVAIMDDLENALGPQGVQTVQAFYHEHLNRGITWAKFRNLQTIYAAQKYMDTLGIPVIETYMDHSIADQQWHVPDYITTLQTLVLPRLKTWNGANFLEWCRQGLFEITAFDHPLLPAHQAAALFWRDSYAQALAR